jgi:hypothetical protein
MYRAGTFWSLHARIQSISNDSGVTVYRKHGNLESLFESFDAKYKMQLVCDMESIVIDCTSWIVFMLKEHSLAILMEKIRNWIQIDQVVAYLEYSGGACSLIYIDQ